MLTSLLPGLRHLRTPFATGCLYALCLWLIIAPTLLAAAQSNLVLQRLDLLSGFLGKSASLGALAFAGYLLGTLLVIPGPRTIIPRNSYLSNFRPYGIDEYDVRPYESGLALWRWRWINFRSSKRRIRKAVLYACKSLRDIFRVHSGIRADISSAVIDKLTSSYQHYQDQIHTWVAANLSKQVNKGIDVSYILDQSLLSGSFRHGLGDAMSHRHTFPGAYNQWESMSPEERQVADELDGQSLLVVTMTNAVANDFRALEVRLQIKHEPLFNEYDRLRAEVELRLSVCIPLILVVIAMTFLNANGLFLFALTIPITLCVVALRKSAEAESIIWQTLLLGEIEAPIMVEFGNIEIEEENPPKNRMGDQFRL
ncbi:hypothetical protein FHX74_001514 [Friedmanniella endophytica]|uniref:Uncharacterized protein n=1 Tax=Microlunatus kandeliicorticis TaxID=1759536 RepID=A0A7W3IRG8_9ACTN|nr:hypothetical protein [Microlunatus kandeliicorticis]MBA8793909.1 hypothetical protein [Microlunatus kandeliicorticis]